MSNNAATEIETAEAAIRTERDKIIANFGTMIDWKTDAARKAAQAVAAEHGHPVGSILNKQAVKAALELV